MAAMLDNVTTGSKVPLGQVMLIEEVEELERGEGLLQHSNDDAYLRHAA